MFFYFRRTVSFMPVRVKTLEKFSAVDPWHQNKITEFTMEIYKMVANSVGSFGGRLPYSKKLYGIRSSLNNQLYRLPEALAELWQTHQVKPELLPQILWKINPSLVPNDYLLYLHVPRMFHLGLLLIAGWIGMGLIFYSSYINTKISSAEEIVFFFCNACFGVAYLIAAWINRNKKIRRKNQMEEWLSLAKSL